MYQICSCASWNSGPAIRSRTAWASCRAGRPADAPNSAVRAGGRATCREPTLLSMGGYRRRLSARSLADPADFWAEQAEAVDWYTRPETILDATRAPLYRWFAGGVLNTCYNALDRHVIRGRAEQPALIFHSAYTGARRTYTYAELLRTGGPAGRRAARARRQPGRPGGDLSADGARGGDRHAGLRPDRRGALGGLRRLRRRPSSRPGSTTPSPRWSSPPPAGWRRAR